MIDKFERLLAPVGLIHEIWHYLAAKLFGFEARLGFTEVVIVRHGDPDWRHYIVALAPAFVGLVVFSLIISICLLLGLHWPAIGFVFVGLGWQWGCEYDWRKVVKWMKD